MTAKLTDRVIHHSAILLYEEKGIGMETRAEAIAIAFDPSTAAKQAVEKVGPRVYELINLPEGPLSFLIMGCQGNGGNKQKKTAALMNQIVTHAIEHGEPMPICLFGAGDNIYDNGVDDPCSVDFDTHIHNIYYDTNLPALRVLPIFPVLGNHDENMHALAMPSLIGRPYQGRSVGINQVAHTYVSLDAEGLAEKINFFLQEQLPVDGMFNWNLPYYFYSLIADKLQIFFLNSNSFLLEFLNNEINPASPGFNQAVWFKKEADKAIAAGREILLVQHIPLVVCGKRKFPSKYDSSHFLTEEQIRKLNTLLKEKDPTFVPTYSYNDLYIEALRSLGFKKVKLIVAHEHFMAAYNNVNDHNKRLEIHQFTCGGGGGELHHRASYQDHPYFGAQEKDNGAGVFTFDPDHPEGYQFDLYTLKGLHLQFNEKNQNPIVTPHQDPEVMLFRERILKICDSVFQFLKQAELSSKKAESVEMQSIHSQQSTLSWIYSSVKNTAYSATTALSYSYSHDKHTLKECQVLQRMQAYVNQHTLPDLETMQDYILELAEKLPHREQRPPHRMLLDDHLKDLTADIRQSRSRFVNL